MANGSLGFSFDPSQQFNGSGGANGSGGGGRSRLSPQQAVRILSLRVPESLPSNAPVNRALLTSPGGSAAGANGLNSMIQQLIEAFKPSQAAQQGVPALPPPDVLRPPSGAPDVAGPVFTSPGPSGQPRPTPAPFPMPTPAPMPTPTPAPPRNGPGPTTTPPHVVIDDPSGRGAPPAIPAPIASPPIGAAPQRRPRGGFFDMDAPPLF